MKQEERLEIIKPILIVRYIDLFSLFENETRTLFSNIVQKLEHRYKSKLYFAYGCDVGSNVHYDYETTKLTLLDENKEGYTPPRYDDNEMFGALSLMKMIRFDKQEHIIDCFNDDVPSIQKKEDFKFHDCIIKIINMRNRLAHNMFNIEFKEKKDIIERLSDSYIEQDPLFLFKNVEFSKCDIDSMVNAIYSNYVYMDILYSRINKSYQEIIQGQS